MSGEKRITVAAYWPNEGYGGGKSCTSLEEANAEAEEMAKFGYGFDRGGTIHIIETTTTVTVFDPKKARAIRLTYESEREVNSKKRRCNE